MTSVWVLLECLLRNSVCPWNLVQGSTPCQLYELVHNPHTPTHIHIPLHSPHIHSVTSYRLSVGSWATLGQAVPFLSESMTLEIILYGWMASSVLGMRVLWHCVLLVDGRIITVHMLMMQGLYVQVEVDCMTGLTSYCSGYGNDSYILFCFPFLLFFSLISSPSSFPPHPRTHTHHTHMHILPHIFIAHIHIHLTVIL